MKCILPVSVICLGLICSSGAEEPAPAEVKPAPETFFFLGDSITKAGGYVRAIQSELVKQNPTNPPQIHNFGHIFFGDKQWISKFSTNINGGSRSTLL